MTPAAEPAAPAAPSALPPWPGSPASRGQVEPSTLAAWCQDPTQAAPHRAVVIGASLAGLLAARVLADHFDEVLLLDRGALDDTLDPRQATPHTRHTHALLARGRQVLETLFPGITDDWRAAGASFGDVGSQAAFYAGSRRFAQVRPTHWPCAWAAARSKACCAAACWRWRRCVRWAASRCRG